MIVVVVTKMCLLNLIQKKRDTAKSNETIEFIQNSQEFIRDIVRRKETTFNRY